MELKIFFDIKLLNIRRYLDGEFTIEFLEVYPYGSFFMFSRDAKGHYWLQLFWCWWVLEEPETEEETPHDLDLI